MAETDPEKKSSMGFGMICLIIILACVCISIISYAAGGNPFIQFLLIANCLAMLSQ